MDLPGTLALCEKDSSLHLVLPRLTAQGNDRSAMTCVNVNCTFT